MNKEHDLAFFFRFNKIVNIIHKFVNIIRDWFIIIPYHLFRIYFRQKFKSGNYIHKRLLDTQQPFFQLKLVPDFLKDFRLHLKFFIFLKKRVFVFQKVFNITEIVFNITNIIVKLFTVLSVGMSFGVHKFIS